MYQIQILGLWAVFFAGWARVGRAESQGQSESRLPILLRVGGTLWPQHSVTSHTKTQRTARRCDAYNSWPSSQRARISPFANHEKVLNGTLEKQFQVRFFVASFITADPPSRPSAAKAPLPPRGAVVVQWANPGGWGSAPLAQRTKRAPCTPSLGELKWHTCRKRRR